MDEIEANGDVKILKITPSSTYSEGEERDLLISKASALLNIHTHDNFTIYESIRCERWRQSGMPILSESSFEYKNETTYKNILFLDKTNLIVTAKSKNLRKNFIKNFKDQDLPFDSPIDANTSKQFPKNMLFLNCAFAACNNL